MVFQSLIGIYTQPPPPLHTYYHIRALGDVFFASHLKIAVSLIYW